jgi:hypothetical protein
MKSIPSANAASSASHSASASATPRPSGSAANPAARPATTASPSPSSQATAARTAAPASSVPRASATADYRANVERQTREQKSVGSLLAYVVYGFIAVFIICAGLSIYGAVTIFDRLHDQSVTVTDLDSRYSEANKEINAKLTVTQDTLSQAQAEITRQQDLIVKQQEELNRLIATQDDLANALKTEKSARATETSALRARVKDVEARQAQIRQF